VAVFIDTSALIALTDNDDSHHERALATWGQITEAGERRMTSNYVVLETTALLGRRFGIEIVGDFYSEVLPVLDVHWVDEELHSQGLAILLAAGLRDLSLVDYVSFQLMRRLGLGTAFAFDRHFVQQAFRCIP
jgi:uncharacterized protein